MKILDKSIMNCIMARIFGLRTVFVLIAVTSVMIPLSRSQTIADIIGQRDDLSLIYRYMTGTGVLQRLASTDTTYTFFAPHNTAFLNISEQIRGLFNSASRTTQFSDDVFSYHTAQAAVYTSAVTGTSSVYPVPTVATGNPRLFLINKGEIFINGARFIEPNLDITNGGPINGVLHIIDKLFYEPRFNKNAYYFVRNTAVGYKNSQESTATYANILDAYQYAVQSSKQIFPTPGYDAITNWLNGPDGNYVTSFIPSDEAMKTFIDFNKDRYVAIKNGGDPILLQKVVESHVVPNLPLHSNAFEAVSLQQNSNISAIQGKVRVYHYNGQLYVSNNCVQAPITKANITTSNGVVHMIGNVLGFVFNDAYTQIKRDFYWLSEFYGAVESSTPDIRNLLQIPVLNTGDVPDSEKMTIFAPINRAFRKNDFDQNLNVNREQMLKLMVRGVLNIMQMTNGTVIETLLPGVYVKFYQFDDRHYAEVDYVRAHIVQDPACVRNGVIFKTNEILGVPCCSIYQYIRDSDKLTNLEDVLYNCALAQLLDSASHNLTIFAPIDFSDLHKSSVGQSLLNNRLWNSRMRNLMLRHIVNATIFLDTLTYPTTLQSLFDTITLTVDSDAVNHIQWGTQSIRVVVPNIRMNNGVVHVIEKVIFTPTDTLTGPSSSASPVRYPTSVTFTVLSVLVVLLPLYRTNVV